jgi:hypothetical protein
MKSETRPKHITQRTCAACHSVKPKRELVRLVRLADGKVEVDTTGRKDGRGAYLCMAPECWEKGLTEKQIERTLHTGLTAENRKELREYGKSLLSLTR